MFYKDFGRPIAKVFLMAFFTYQVTYWAWVKMEKEEAKVEKESMWSFFFLCDSEWLFGRRELEVSPGCLFLLMGRRGGFGAWGGGCEVEGWDSEWEDGLVVEREGVGIIVYGSRGIYSVRQGIIIAMGDAFGIWKRWGVYRTCVRSHA